MIKVCIIGANGYSGEELIRLLSKHPSVELAAVTSRSQAGKAVSDVLPKMKGLVADDLVFTTSDPSDLAKDESIDLYFLALPHGVAYEYAAALLEAGKTVIDLSADFRLRDPDLYKVYYDIKHPYPEYLKEAPYVIPELAKGWQDARLIACPGCYPTSIQLPLIPLLKAKAIPTQPIVINSYSGISGAGKKLSEAFLYAERNESCKAYGIGTHRHLAEIEEQCTLAAASHIEVQFTPHLAPMTRGILSTIVVPALLDDGYTILSDQYAGTPFVHVLKPGAQADTQHVINSNHAHISIVHDKRTNNYIITSAIDNLLKGASGQAVQIMNLKYGFPETCGL